jgi:hypothetical protein
LSSKLYAGLITKEEAKDLILKLKKGELTEKDIIK